MDWRQRVEWTRHTLAREVGVQGCLRNVLPRGTDMTELTPADARAQAALVARRCMALPAPMCNVMAMYLGPVDEARRSEAVRLVGSVVGVLGTGLHNRRMIQWAMLSWAGDREARAISGNAMLARMRAGGDGVQREAFFRSKAAVQAWCEQWFNAALARLDTTEYRVPLDIAREPAYSPFP